MAFLRHLAPKVDQRKIQSSQIRTEFLNRVTAIKNKKPNNAPSACVSTRRAHHFLVLPRLGGKRSSLKGWAGDNQGPIQLPGAQCSQHRASLSSESCCFVAHPKPPCELPISVKAGVPSLSRSFLPLSRTYHTPLSRVVCSWCSPRLGSRPQPQKGLFPSPRF